MTNSKQYPNLYNFYTSENKQFTRSIFTKLVHTNSRFEGVNTTFSQTQKIMDGMIVPGVPIEDILTIVNLKRGWLYVTNQDSLLTLKVEKIVAAEDALVPGQLRQGQGSVHIEKEEFFEPPLIEEKQELNFLQQTLNDPYRQRFNCNVP